MAKARAKGASGVAGGADEDAPVVLDDDVAPTEGLPVRSRDEVEADIAAASVAPVAPPEAETTGVPAASSDAGAGDAGATDASATGSSATGSGSTDEEPDTADRVPVPAAEALVVGSDVDDAGDLPAEGEPSGADASDDSGTAASDASDDDGLTPPLPHGADDGEDLSSRTLVSLRALAKDRGLTNVSRLSKGALVERLTQG